MTGALIFVVSTVLLVAYLGSKYCPDKKEDSDEIYRF